MHRTTPCSHSGRSHDRHSAIYLLPRGLAGRATGRVQLGQRAALYCRVSTSDQSCDRQERDLAAFAERAGYEVVGTYKETASGVRLDRAERRKVLARLIQRCSELILISG